MTPDQHISAAVEHLLCAISYREKNPDHSDLRGTPLVEFDGGGQLLWQRLRHIVQEERHVTSEHRLSIPDQ